MSLDEDEEKLRVFAEHPLFQGFSPHQIQLMLGVAQTIHAEPGDVIIRENEVSDQIYIIKQGEVVVYRQDCANGNTEHHLAVLGANAVIGELTLLDNAPRSASVRVSKPGTVFYAFSVKQIQSLSDEKHSYKKITSKLQELEELVSEPPFYSIMIQNLAKGLGQRIRSANDAVVDALRKELVHTKARVAMGVLIINTLVMLAVYVLAVKFLDEQKFRTVTSMVVSIPELILFSLGTIFVIYRSGYPLKVYGITLNEWQPAVREALIVSGVLFALFVVMKISFIQFLPAYAHRAIFDGEFFAGTFPLKTSLLMMSVYFLFVPLQELMARGLLQGSFQEFLIGKNTVPSSILLSNLLFSLTHYHLKLLVIGFVFFSGLIWGWMFSRHRTLVGVILSHWIVGISGLFIIGA